MAANPIFERIGEKLRQDSREIVNAQLPKRLRTLLQALARADNRRDEDGAMRRSR